jgi:hypothetical protein
LFPFSMPLTGRPKRYRFFMSATSRGELSAARRSRDYWKGGFAPVQALGELGTVPKRPKGDKGHCVLGPIKANQGQSPDSSPDSSHRFPGYSSLICLACTQDKIVEKVGTSMIGVRPGEMQISYL